MIAFLDVNTIWRRKFADALERRAGDVPLVAPSSDAPGALDPNVAPIQLIRGWAGPLAWLATQSLLRRIARPARSRGGVSPIVVTTPHYLPLARRATRLSKIVYYCSDDHRYYTGWNAARVTHIVSTL